MSVTPEDVSFKLKEAIRLSDEAQKAALKAAGRCEEALGAQRLAL